MHTQTTALSASALLDSAINSVPFTPPPHVRRWTGRAALTIPLPSLAALRISSLPATARDANAARA